MPRPGPAPTFRIAVALASGAALALAYPDYKLSLLGWIALAGLTYAAMGASKRLAAVCGLCFGLVHYPIGLPWIYTVLREYGPLPGWQAGGLLALLSLAGAVFFALFAMGVAWLSRRGEGLALAAAPFLWVAMEYLRTHMPDIGFPWNLLGYTAANSLALVQITSVTGIFGLSLLVGAYNSLFLWALLSATRRRGRSIVNPATMTWAATTATLALIALFGSSLVPAAQPTHIANLVQTSLPQSMTYERNWSAVHAKDMEQIDRMSIEAGRAHPGLVVWPEVPAPFSLEQGGFAEQAATIAREARSKFLLGVVHWQSAGNGMAAYNAAAMLDASGRPVMVYDKIHLVPFSEYIPWRSALGFASDLTGLIGDFSTGHEYSVGQLSGGRYSVFICYEAIFPDQVRQYVSAGAQLLINISNDGWFGKSSALGQHAAMARVRAVENRRWLLRDTNTGETISVDPYGRIAARLPRYDRGVLAAPYGFRSDMTFYTRWGDWIAWASVIAAALFFTAGSRKPVART